MFVLISTTCALICVGALAWWLVYRSRTRILLAGLPSFNNGCFIKDLYMLWGDSQNLLAVIKLITKWSEENNLPLVAWIGPLLPFISFSDSSDVKSIMNSYLDTPFFYDFAKCLLGNGLITAPVSIWKQNHKKLAGTYTTGSLLNSYQKVFCAQAHALVQKLKEEAGREPFDLQHKYLDYTSLAAIYQITVNQRLDKVNPEVCKAYNRCLALFAERGFNPLYYSDFVYRLTPSYKELMGYVKLLNNLLDMEIEERRRERDEKMERNGSLDKSNGKAMDTFLDKLLELSETDPMFTKQQIMEELNTMIISGLETVSITLTLLLILIGNKRDIQGKMYDEIKEIFGDGVRQVEKEDLSRMRYCEAVINETLRLYPAVPMVLRNAGHELQLESVTIPKGAICGINVWGVHRSKRLWGPDADEFRPERWLEDRVVSSATFIPYGYGKRMCTGDDQTIKLNNFLYENNIEIAKEKSAVPYQTATLLKPNVWDSGLFFRDFDVGPIEKVVQFDGLVIPLKKSQHIKKIKRLLCYGSLKYINTWERSDDVGERPDYPLKSLVWLRTQGSKYAMTFLKTMLAYCIRELKFESEGGELQLKLDVSLKTVSGHLIRVRLHE